MLPFPSFAPGVGLVYGCSFYFSFFGFALGVDIRLLAVAVASSGRILVLVPFFSRFRLVSRTFHTATTLLITYVLEVCGKCRQKCEIRSAHLPRL